MSRLLDCFASKEERRLLRVDVLIHRDLRDVVAALQLRFPSHALSILAEPDDDTLVCCTGEISPEAMKALENSPSAFWNPLIGYVLTDVWAMLNEGDAIDALHLRFREAPNQGRVADIQVMAIASSLKLFELTVVREQWSATLPANPL